MTTSEDKKERLQQAQEAHTAALDEHRKAMEEVSRLRRELDEAQSVAAMYADIADLFEARLNAELAERDERVRREQAEIDEMEVSASRALERQTGEGF